MKATPEEEALHQRLLVRDRLAAVDLANLLYDTLVRAVRARVDQTTDPELIEDAVVEALMSYVDDPQRYDPQKGTLKVYLTIVAHSDLKNALRKARRRNLLFVSLSDPGLQEQTIVDYNQQDDGKNARAKVIERIWVWLEGIFPDPVDQKIAELIMNKVRSPEPYIEAMKLENQSREEQLVQVHRAKDRISRQMRRKGGMLHGEV